MAGKVGCTVGIGMNFKPGSVRNMGIAPIFLTFPGSEFIPMSTVLVVKGVRLDRRCSWVQWVVMQLDAVGGSGAAVCNGW